MFYQIFASYFRSISTISEKGISTWNFDQGRRALSPSKKPCLTLSQMSLAFLCPWECTMSACARSHVFFHFLSTSFQLWCIRVRPSLHDAWGFPLFAWMFVWLCMWVCLLMCVQRYHNRFTYLLLSSKQTQLEPHFLQPGRILNARNLKALRWVMFVWSW